jgi:hypothetical protein
MPATSQILSLSFEFLQCGRLFKELSICVAQNVPSANDNESLGPSGLQTDIQAFIKTPLHQVNRSPFVTARF